MGGKTGRKNPRRLPRYTSTRCSTSLETPSRRPFLDFQNREGNKNLRNRHLGIHCYYSSREHDDMKESMYASFQPTEEDARMLKAAKSIQKRGWVLQESALAVGKLQYCDTGLEWYCEGLSAKEDSLHLHRELTIDEQSIPWDFDTFSSAPNT